MSRQTSKRKHGRGHSYRLDGEKVQGVTTILSKGLPKGGLVPWASNTCAQYTADNIDDLAKRTPSEIFDLVKGAPNRDRDQAANRGTEVHRLAEQLVQGDKVEVPDELAGHVESYLDFLEDWAVDPILVEATVINRRIGYMGTLDLVARLRGLGPCLIDVKTNRSGPFEDTALQLAAYRHAETYLDDDGEEQPMPTVDWSGVCWVRGDGYDLVEFDTSKTYLNLFICAKQIARLDWKDGDLRPKGDAIYPPKEAAS